MPLAPEETQHAPHVVTRLRERRNPRSGRRPLPRCTPPLPAPHSPGNTRAASAGIQGRRGDCPDVEGLLTLKRLAAWYKLINPRASFCERALCSKFDSTVMSARASRGSSAYRGASKITWSAIFRFHGGSSAKGSGSTSATVSGSRGGGSGGRMQSGNAPPSSPTKRSIRPASACPAAAASAKSDAATASSWQRRARWRTSTRG